MKMHLFKLLGSALVLTALLWWAGASQVLERLREAHIGWLALSFLTLTLATWSMARRWQITARLLKLDISYPHALKEYYVAQLINSVLPGGVLGDIGRAFRLRDKGDLVRAGQSVFLERLIGQIAMFSIMALGFAGALFLPGGLDWPWTVASVLISGALVGAVCVLLAYAAKAIRSAVIFVGRMLFRRAIFLHAFLAAFLLIVSLYACARATGTLIPPEGWLTILPLVFCAMLVPLSIAGWGWREGAAAALFPLIGASPSAGVAMGISYGAMMLLATLPALAFMILGKGSGDPAQLENA